MKKTIRYAGLLVKGNIQYYFEIRDFVKFSSEKNRYIYEKEAYIEKTFRVGGMRNEEHFGTFTIEQAHKCYKALLNKGFEPEHYLF